jgi:hypothetical protein
VKRNPEKGMDAARFRALLASYGADVARWPEGERAQARAFATTSREAALWLEEERRLDALLDGAPGMAPSPSLLRRVAEIPARNVRSAWQPFGGARRWLAGALAAAAMGAIVGSVTPDSSNVADASIVDDLSPLSWAGDLAEVLSP